MKQPTTIIEWIAFNGGLDRSDFIRYTGADFTPKKQKFYIANMNPRARKVIKDKTKTFKHKWDKKIRFGNTWFEPFPVEGGLDMDSMHQRAIEDKAIDYYMELDDFGQLVLDCFNGDSSQLYSDVIENDYSEQYASLPINENDLWKVRVKAGDYFCLVGTTNDLNEAKQLLFAYPNEVKKITRY